MEHLDEVDDAPAHELPHHWAENTGHDDFIDDTGFPVHGNIAEFAKSMIKQEVEIPGPPPVLPELKTCSCLPNACEHEDGL